MIAIVARLVAKEGQQEAFEAAMAELTAEVRAAEPGCLLYQVFRKEGSKTEYTVMERYVSREAMEAHGRSPHFLRMAPRLAPLLGAPLDIEVLEPIGAASIPE